MRELCTGVEPLTDPEQVAAVLPYPVEKLYGRKVCASCHGAVFVKSDGTLRRHVKGSNT